MIASGDGGDYPTVDALDLVEVRLIENVVNDTVRIEWQVRGTSTPPPSGAAYRYLLYTSIDGVARMLDIGWNGTAATCTARSPAGCVAERSGNVFSATYPAATLGATEGAVLFDVIAFSHKTPGAFFTGGLLKGQGTEDRAPGPLTATEQATPRRGEEHVFVGQSIDPPTGQVHLTVDGGAPRTVASGVGTFPWSTRVGPVSPGTHTLTARLFLDGASTPAATDTVTVFKARD